MTPQQLDELYAGVETELEMGRSETDAALSWAKLGADCELDAAIGACYAWHERKSRRVFRVERHKPRSATEPYADVASAAGAYCRENPHLAQLVKRENADGILFIDLDEFIVFADLGYNPEFGFFDREILNIRDVFF